ncbi:hypothetical protein [Cohnella sp. AR92]|nr:hypothetical protein [Cohnella sp. AR92]
MNGRSRVLHEKRMSELACPILRIEGEQTVEERVNRVMEVLIT